MVYKNQVRLIKAFFKVFILNSIRVFRKARDPSEPILCYIYFKKSFKDSIGCLYSISQSITYSIIYLVQYYYRSTQYILNYYNYSLQMSSNILLGNKYYTAYITMQIMCSNNTYILIYKRRLTAVQQYCICKVDFLMCNSK